MTLAFLGTKGGTGTTTMAVNISAEIHRVTGRPTVLVDLKPAPGDVALFLGLRPRRTLAHLLDRMSWLDAGQLHDFVSPHACGLGVLAAGEEWGRPAPRDAEGVEAVVHGLRSSYDFVVLDAGSALTPCTAAALLVCDVVVLVANPDVPCLRNLQRLTDAVRLEGVSGDRLRMLLNRASDDGTVSVAQIGAVLGVPIDWSVPVDYRTVALAVTSGVPVRALRAASELHRHFEGVARSLAGKGAAGGSRMTAIVAPRDDSGASQ
jgi:pilus assembly protein CpaE